MHYPNGTNGVNGANGANGSMGRVSNGVNGHSGAAHSSVKTQHDSNMPLAIVGMACRFPGDASNPEKFWSMLSEGRSGWSKVPSDRFNQSAFFHPKQDMSGTFNTTGGHFLTEDISLFDAPFFNISPIEAKALDPQQRIQLEVTYEALENAGIPMENVVGSDTSVYMATFNRDYQTMIHRDPDNQPLYSVTGNGSSILSNRVSYFFDLKGASFTLDTGCSGSLVAFHQACQSIRSGESQLSIVGGSNLILDPEVMMGMSSLQFFSDDGRCYTFDSRASGYGRSEGVASIVIKSLASAVKDGDPIQAVIRSSVVNQDGRTLGITMPHRKAQEDAIRMAYRNANLEFNDTAYFEAHGTGTRLGDPIEAGAIASTLGSERPFGDPLIIGSVKTNIGHMESTSGLGGVLKAVLMINKGFIPPNLNFKEPNTEIPLEKWKLRVPTVLEPWPQGKPRRVSVNSFGYGGTNAHCILESAETYFDSHKTHGNGYANGHSRLLSSPDPTDSNGSTEDNDLGQDQSRISRTQVFVLSSASKNTTLKLMPNLRDYLDEREQSHGTTLLSDLAYTLYSRRSALPWRLAIAAATPVDLAAEFSRTDRIPQLALSEPKAGFVFTGQGAQWPGMAVELMKTYPVFRSSMVKADKYFKSLGASWSLLDELAQPSSTSQIHTATISQPSCTAIQNSLVDLLASWNVRPVAVCGHSSGEISAAYACGALDFSTTLTIAYYRGLLADEMKVKSPQLRGAMLAVGLSEQDTETCIAQIPPHVGKMAIACVNSPTTMTVSGDQFAIQLLESALKARDVFVRRLSVDIAYHSHHMEEIAADYSLALAKLVKPKTKLQASFISSVTGQLAAGEDLNHTYWVRNMVSQVRFSEALENLCRSSLSNKTLGGDVVSTLIEIGPHSALAGPIKQTLSASSWKSSDIKYYPSLIRNVDPSQAIANLAGELFTRGHPIDLSAVNSPEPKQKHTLIDLPPYPWDHSIKHWHETRLSVDFRKRQYPRHYLLGAPSADRNALEPSWRNYLRVSENPWLRGHVVQSNIVFPAAGYIAMVLEASGQTFNSKESKDAVSQEKGGKNLRYDLRDISIGRALIVPDTLEGVEINLVLRPYNTSLRFPSEQWHEFVVFSYSEKAQWSEHCRGLVSVHHDSAPEEVEGDRVKSCKVEDFQDKLRSARQTCKSDMKPQEMYENLKNLGLEYGGPFTSVASISTNQNEALGVVRIPDTAAEMPAGFEHPLIIHPATLDSCLQMVFPPLWKSGGTLEPMVPTKIDEISVSHDLCTKAAENLHVYTSSWRDENQQCVADLAIFGADSIDAHLPMLEISGVMLSSLAGGGSMGEETAERNIASTMQWGFDLSLLDPLKTKQICTAALSKDYPVTEKYTRSRALSLYFINKALESISDSDLQLMKPYHQKYYEWMKEERAFCAGKSNVSNLSALMEAVKSYGADGEMLCRIGEHMVPIVKGEIEPLGLMMENDLLIETYKSDSMNRLYDMMAKYLGLLSFKKPDLNILEIGAGTGGATIPALEALSNPDFDVGYAHFFSHYDFTDISSGFFEKATERLAGWQGLVDFKRLDIEKKPSEQGFAEGTHDVIVACNVLHATSKIANTLENARSLLKPGGKLIVIEDTEPNIEKCLIFGSLPGWWLGVDDGRLRSPYLTVDGWSSALSNTGFELDVYIPDYETSNDWRGTLMISTAVESDHTSKSSDIEVICKDGQSMARTTDTGRLSTSLLNALGSNRTSIRSLDDIEVTSKFYVCLVEAEDLVLRDCTDAQFDVIKKLMMQAKGVLWVTRGGTMESSSPAANLFAGLARTARSENPGARIFTLDLDESSPLTDAGTINAILQVLKPTLDDGITNGPIDLEFSERNGNIYIPRVVGSRTRNDILRGIRATPEPEIQSLFQKGRPLRLSVSQPGLLDSMRFIDHDAALDPLGYEEIRAEIRAIGINFRDIMIALGQIGGQSTFYGESSGIVTEVGAGMTEKYKPGDRICFTTDQGYSSVVRISGRRAIHIPQEMSFEHAASLQISHTTAYYAIVHQAGLRAGESILIHSAAGALGQAAIMLSQYIGAEIFVTVGTQEKKEFLMETYGIKEDHIFSSRRFNFVRGIKQLTKNRGVDVVLNSLAGEGMRETLKTLASLGRFVEVGKRDSVINTRIEMNAFCQNVTYFFVDLSLITESSPGLHEEIMQKTFDLIEKGAMRAVTPISVFPIPELETAFRKFQTGKQIGKLVLKCDPDAQVKVLPRVLDPPPLHQGATYLIAGGLGGLGRAICQWMASWNVKNIIVLSRSGLEKDSSKLLAKELEEQGVKLLAPKCDLGSRQQVEHVLADCQKHMPPIRGVIQSALLLKDTILENMSADDYHTVMGPKLHGSYNILESISADTLDFFLLLSSGAGVIGNRGQGNYASASTFQDALARHYALKSNTIFRTLDLGEIESVGYVVENADTVKLLFDRNAFSVALDELLAMISHAISAPVTDADSSQVILGLQPVDLSAKEGFELPWLLADAKFSHLRHRGSMGAAKSNSQDKSGTRDALSKATSLEEASKIVCDALILKTSRILAMKPEEVGPDRTFMSYGADSLVAVELRNWFNREMEAGVQILDILGSKTISQLATEVAEKSKLVGFSAEPSPE